MEIIKQDIDQEKIRIEMGIEYNKEKNTVSGQVELDIENQSLFIEIINSILEQGSKHIIVDMSNISYIDSSGLWALFEGFKKTSQKKRKMVLLNPTKDVKRVLEITKMSSKILLYDNEQEAIQSL